MRFINDDVKLKVGGRTAAPISETELEEMMQKLSWLPIRKSWLTLKS